MFNIYVKFIFSGFCLDMVLYNFRQQPKRIVIYTHLV